ncbi:hypothetical protein BDW66DRAFT_158365 [Aspergillus desertorum]
MQLRTESYHSVLGGQTQPPAAQATNANVTRKRRSTTCEATGSSSCEQCQKDQVACIETRRGIRFSDASANWKIAKGHALSEASKPRIPRKLAYVDETAELTATYRQDDDERQPASTGLGSTTSGIVPPPSAAGLNNLPAPSDRSALHGLVKLPSTMPHSPNSTLEFNLLGYFIDHLSMWLDLCDPERHFQIVVPHRARSCPPLLNAILAASARNLTRLPKYRTASGAVENSGRILQDLTDETALHYQHQMNEDLLAAAIILRFYEEVDYPLQEDRRDNELFLRVLNMFIEAQIPNAYRSPPSLQTVIPTLESRWYMSSLWKAAFWVAFRQEVYSAFQQRPFNMSLSRCDVFRSFTPGEDALWTARLVIFCADVLEFCYGNTAHAPTQESTRERWDELNALSHKWAEFLPSSFEPIYCREAYRQNGEVFPVICYLSHIHVAGVQHLELARTLLAVYNPAIRRLGLGYRESMRNLSRDLRATNPPSLTTALLGIVVCGEHIEDEAEQRAILGLLDELEYHHGWPVASYRDQLKESWGWP